MLLHELTQLAGVSGDEQQVRDYLINIARKVSDELVTDSMGNLIAVKGKAKPGPKVMLTAHMDEPGLMITGVHDTGLLHCVKVGELNEQTLLGSNWLVGSRGVPGVIGSKPVHLLQGDERRRMPSTDDVFIDIGATSKQAAEKLVSLGDYATPATKYAEFGDRLAKAKALSSRAGCYALLRLLEKEFNFPLYVAFTVQKEIGLRGARIAAYRVNPAIAYVVTGMAAQDIPGAEEHQQGVQVGAGPAISFMDRSSISDHALVQNLVQAAAAQSISVQYRQESTGTNDAGAVQLAREGVRSATIAIPCRYSGSPVQVVSLDDVENTTRLLEAALDELARKECRP